MRWCDGHRCLTIDCRPRHDVILHLRLIDPCRRTLHRSHRPAAKACKCAPTNTMRSNSAYSPKTLRRMSHLHGSKQQRDGVRQRRSINFTCDLFAAHNSTTPQRFSCEKLTVETHLPFSGNKLNPLSVSSSQARACATVDGQGWSWFCLTGGSNGTSANSRRGLAEGHARNITMDARPR